MSKKTPWPALVDRFWSRIGSSGDCWEYNGSRNSAGYEIFVINGSRRVQAHRFAYEDMVGPVPDGLELDHLCRNRACVNPDHLDPVTHRVNVLRGVSSSALRARQTHCKWGHEFTPENTRVRPNAPRECKTCARAGAKRRRGK